MMVPIETIICNEQKRTKSITFDNSTSIVYMSAANRANIRPMGVVSKKLCGALNTDCTKFECKVSEAWIPNLTRNTVRMYVKTPTRTASIAYTVRYSHCGFFSYDASLVHHAIVDDVAKDVNPFMTVKKITTMNLQYPPPA